MEFQLKSLVLLSILFVGATAHAGTCDLTDARDPVSQLNCFCAPGDNTLLRQSLSSQPGMAKLATKFKLAQKVSCEFGVTSTLTFIKDPAIDSKVDARLKELGMDAQSIASIEKSAQRKREAVRVMLASGLGGLGLLGGGSHSETKISFSFFGIKVERSSSEGDRKRLNELGLTTEEILDIATTYSHSAIEFRQEPFSFRGLFQKLSDFASISQTRSGRVDACLSLGNSEDDFMTCAASEASDAVIKACIAWPGAAAYQKKDCISAGASDEKIGACGNINSLAAYQKLDCLKTSAKPNRVEACGRLKVAGYQALECMEKDATNEKITACGSLSVPGYQMLECLETPATPDQVRSCGQRESVGYKALECMNR
jgi:hypothetical protein